MKKKTSRNIILLIITALVIFVVFDFFKDSSKEKEAREAASQSEETVVQDENEDLEKEETSDFSTSDELDEEIVRDEDSEENDKSPEVSYGANPGDTAYDFELTDIETGESVKLSDYRGQKVFLNFWASWCPPCRVEAPHLQDFSENQEEVVVLGVNVKVSETDEENVQDFIDEFGLTFQNAYGPDEMFGPFFVESLPTSFFIDSKGVIRERVTGPVTEDILNGTFEMID